MIYPPCLMFPADNRRWFMSAGMIETLYSYLDLDITLPYNNSNAPTPEKAPKLEIVPTIVKSPSRSIQIPSTPTRKASNLSSSPNLITATLRNEFGGSNIYSGQDDDSFSYKNEHEMLFSCLNVTCKLAELEGNPQFPQLLC